MLIGSVAFAGATLTAHRQGGAEQGPASKGIPQTPEAGRRCAYGPRTGANEVMLSMLLSPVGMLSAAAGHKVTAWGQFVEIISKPDNMPVAGALLLVVFFTWFALKQAFHNDRLIAEKRKNEILSDMQK